MGYVLEAQRGVVSMLCGVVLSPLWGHPGNTFQ